MLTGAYHVPSRTITGSVEKDVAIIDRVIGVKCAISDHRSAAPDVYHLANMAAESRVGGLLGGKPWRHRVPHGRQQKGVTACL